MPANNQSQICPLRPESTCIGSAVEILLSQSGQSLLEMALLLPMLLALALGTIEMGRFAYISILVANAAHAGAAYGTQSLRQSVDTTGIETAADNDFQNNGQSAANLTVSSSTSCGCDDAGTLTSAVCLAKTNPNAGLCNAGHWVVMVSVTTSGSFTSLFGFPGIPRTLDLSSTSTMRVVSQ